MRNGGAIGTAAGALAIGCGLLAATPSVAAPTPDGARYDALIAAATSSMVTDPERARRQARAARELAAKVSDPRGRALAEAEAGWLEGEALSRTIKPGLARPILEAALASVNRFHRGSRLHGDLLRTSGVVESMTGQVQKALEDLQRAHGIFLALGEAKKRAGVLQDIGTIYFDARDYPRALRYDAQAVEAYGGDPGFTVTIAEATVVETGKTFESMMFASPSLFLMLFVKQKIESWNESFHCIAISTCVPSCSPSTRIGLSWTTVFDVDRSATNCAIPPSKWKMCDLPERSSSSEMISPRLR